MFILKKIISALIEPLPLGIFIELIGLYLLWFTRKQKTGKIFVTTGLIFISLISWEPVANYILSPLETSYSKYEHNHENIKYVVVLGGGHTSDPAYPLSSQIHSPSLARLIEGISIYRQNPGSRLVLSGGKGSGTVPNAVVMANIAKAVGVPPEDIITEIRPKDTKDEAFFIKDIVKDSLFVLVTSASHMKRSVKLFQHYNLNLIPAPTYFMAKKSNFLLKLPGGRNLEKSEMAVHEYLGIIWAEFRKQT